MRQDREKDEPPGVHAITCEDSSHKRHPTFGDSVGSEVVSATGKNSNSDGTQDGASETQNCFDESLTHSSCFEMVNKQDSMIESRLSDDIRM